MPSSDSFSGKRTDIRSGLVDEAAGPVRSGALTILGAARRRVYRRKGCGDGEERIVPWRLVRGRPAVAGMKQGWDMAVGGGDGDEARISV